LIECHGLESQLLQSIPRTPKKGFLLKMGTSNLPVSPNPKRVAAGRLNHAKRRGLTPEGREQLRQAALRNKPWRHSTGPRTPEGKARAAANGRRRQCGPLSIRQLDAQLADLATFANSMVETRALLE
jgi:hypothetical protein